MGCSFGGRIALELAAARPELVERLVLVGAGLGTWEWSEEAQAGFAEEEEALERGDVAAAAAQQARMWLADDASAEVRALTEAMTLRSYDQQLPMEDHVKSVWPEVPAQTRLAEIGVPTLVVVGSEDVEDINAMAELLVAGIPDARLETIERRRPPAEPRAPGRAQPAAARLSSLSTASERAGHAVFAQSSNSRSVRHASASERSGSTHRNVPAAAEVAERPRRVASVPVQCGASRP